MGCLDGKVAIVTGAGRGIGRAEAILFAKEGARVVVNDLGCDRDGSGRDPSIARAVVDEIASGGGEAVASVQDVTAEGAAEELVRVALDTWGGLDVVVSNAGVVRERTLLNLEDPDLDRMFAVGLLGALRLARAAARVMVERAWPGSLILTSGPHAFFGAARQSASAATAAAIVGLTRSAAVELRRHQIRVNAIAPTARTRATAHLPMFQSVPEESMGPEHVAAVALFLASDLSADVNGEVVGVAGGRVYALRARESTGAFSDDRPLTPEELLRAWPEITRA